MLIKEYGGLFDEHPGMYRTPEVAEPDPNGSHRDALLAALARCDLSTYEIKVAYILQHWPETRDSDTELVIRYWKYHQSDVLAEARPFELDVLHDLRPSFETIARARRRIQNTFGLFQSTTRVQLHRGEIELQFHRYMGEIGTVSEEIRFYLDETGAEPASPVAGVGGLCVMNWRQYERFHGALQVWRRRCGRLNSFHFSEMAPHEEAMYHSWLNQLRQFRGGLLFCGHQFESRRVPACNRISSVMLHLVLDSLERLRSSGSLNESRKLVVFKEQHEGFDALELDSFERELTQRVHGTFGDLVYVEGVKPIPKGSDVLIEYADLIAGSMTRRSLSVNSNHKDRIAEATMNVTGLNQSSPGAVYKFFAAPNRI